MPASLLEQSISPLTYKRLSAQAKQTRYRSHRKCTSCQKRYHTLAIELVGREHAVDVCRNCQIYWFDFREFEMLPLASGGEENFVLPPDLQTALNEIEVSNGRITANRNSFRLDARDFGFGWEKTRGGGPSGWKILLSLFLMPVEREVRVGRRPWITWSLLAVVGGLSYIGFSNLDFALQYGLLPRHIWRDGGITLISYFFIHGGWMHLLSNLYYLWLFGYNVEDEVGPLRYIVTLVLSSVVGGLTHAYLDPDPSKVLVGASAGISGLGMLYMLRVPRARLSLFLLRLPAYSLMIIWILLQIRTAAAQLEGLTAVSALAHLGGALTGVLAYFIWFKLDYEPPVDR